MGNMKKANYIISVIMLLVGVGVVALASSLKIKIGEGDPGAGFWPMMLGILIIQRLKIKKNLKQRHLQSQHRQISEFISFLELLFCSVWCCIFSDFILVHCCSFRH